MKRTEGNMLGFLRIVVVTLLFFGITAGTVSAFNFVGYTYNETKGALSDTNASIEVYSFGPQGPQLNTTHSNMSNATGYFNITNITVSGGQPYFYKIVLRHFNATNNTIDYIGQSLPEFPYQQILQLANGNPIDFYLRSGGTINISAVNVTGNVTTFRYQIKDTKLGYPIASNFNSEVSNALVYVPANRNYSIMIYPNQSFPVSYDLNNLTTYPDNYANISFNTSNLLRRVTGYANLSNGSYNFTNLNIIAYLMEPGSMIFQDHPMPYNMSAWNCDGGDCQSDIYDPANGTFNITLPGAKMTANILLFATANQGANYYGAFRNISLDYSNTSVPNFNFTLETLLGTTTIIQLNNASGGPGGPPGTTNVTTKKLSFQLKNESSGNNISGFAHVEVKVNYSAYNGSTFNWMTDVSQASNGSFSIPVINADINKINIFTQDFAPLKTSKTSAQLATEPIVINLTTFEPGAINQSGPPPEIKIKMLKSNPQCDVPQPAQGCNLFNDAGGEKNMTNFNPFKVVIGGGKISMRMKLVSNNITVHYKNVDMLASGPPDAMFDPSANQTSQNGTLLEQVWRFGSIGPEIYDEVLIGIPLGSVNPNDVSVKLGKLYDNSWNEVWNMSVNDTSQIPSDYSAFNTTWFNSTTGMPCTTSITSPCYLDITRKMVWLTIPHFSGVGPAVSGTAGNFTANLTSSTGIAGRNVTMNFTMNDTANTTSWYNITFPSGFDASGASVNLTINGSSGPSGWGNTTGPLFVNVSSSADSVNASAGVTQYINISNITLPGSAGIKTINVTTSNGLIVPLNYTVVTYGVNLSVSGSAIGTTNATVNNTYTLLLQNNGSATDTYSLTIDSAGASTAALNVSGNITLGSNEIRTLLLNVTNTTTGGIAYVNVTAQSLNDSTQVDYINTTTTITAEPTRNVTLTISPVSASASTRPNVNATYTLNLTNTGNMVDTYTLALSGDTTASVNATSITSINDLAAGASRIFLLNVTNTTQGVFHINVTATSLNVSKFASVNTTTSVTLSAPDVAVSYWGYVVINGVLSSAYVSVHGSNGTEVAHTTSFSNGTYQVSVPWDDLYTTADEGVVSGETITFNVNNISVYSRTINNNGTNNRRDLGLYNGTIIGSVLKATTGIGIDGATVTITNATLGLSVTTTTNSLGSYSAPVFPGTYSINVTKTGYLNNTTTTGKIVYANTSTPVAAILLSPNTVTVTANRTVGSADRGQNVSFNLTVVNTGANATFSVATSVTNSTIATNTTTPSPLLLNTITSTGNVIVEVNNSNLGGWPVTVTITNATQSKIASITLNAIMRDSSVANTTINSTVNNSNVTGGAYLENTTVDNATVSNATLINVIVQDNATISGNSTLIINATITGRDTEITDGSVITGTYRDSNIDNSTIGNATVDSSNLTGSTIGGNASITNSTLIDARVTNSTLTNVTVSGESSITNVASLDNITMGGVTITGQAAYDFEGMISATTTGWVTYQTINFTKVYEAVRISQLVIEQSADIIIPANISTAINTTQEVSRNISMNVTASRSTAINVSETFLSPDGVGLGSKIGNYLVIRSNDTSNVTNHTLRLYLDNNLTNYTSVKIYYYNTTTGWQALTTTASGSESGRWYVEAAPNHFSTFALSGTPVTSTPPGDGSGGGGGGGGGGGKSGENASNIEVIEKYDLQISKDALTAYRFTDERNPIMYVNITGNTTLGIITASVEVLKGTSTLVSFPPEGLVYKNANIWVGTAGFATPKNIKDALIKFRVANSWMSENRVQNSAIVLEKWDGSNWIQLETKFVSKDDTYSIFEGRTNSFSPFAIVATSSGQATPTATSTPAGTPTPGQTGKPGTGDEGGFPTWIIGLVILVIIGAVAYYFLVVKKNE